MSLFTLGDPDGVHARITNLGGIVTGLHVPDRSGKPADVVLGFDRLEPYLGRHPHFGAIIGRIAGRLTGGRFSLDGETYQLALNDGPNHLHGGRVGLGQRLWAAEASGGSLVLTYRSPDGEEGYPGNVDLRVAYSIPGGDALRIDCEATTDRATPLSLTHHSYFNLAGEGRGDVLDHVLQILADEFTPMDERGTLLPRRESVAGEPDDFRQPTRLRERIDALHLRHGNNYLLREAGGALQRVARLEEPSSGRVMEVSTTDTCLQLYTGSHLDGRLVGKSGQPYAVHAGLCLECQGHADAPNQPAFPSITLRPGEVYRQTSVYRFPT